MRTHGFEEPRLECIGDNNTSLSRKVNLEKYDVKGFHQRNFIRGRIEHRTRSGIANK
jgi:hypothetical protein